MFPEADLPAAPEERRSSGPLAWYVLLGIGLCLSGFFPSLMVSWALYSRGRKRLALIAVAASTALFALGLWGALRSPLPWWWVLSIVHAFNLLWSLAAWQLQRRTLGAAPRRYLLAEWKSWLSPILIGAGLGVCASVTFSLPIVLEERARMLASQDTLDRESVLWGALDHVGFGLAAGLLLGLWWAGERKRFRASHVVSFVCGLAVTSVGVGLMALLLLFLLHGGHMPDEMTHAAGWTLVPPWVGGFRRALLAIEKWDISFLVVMPLLFGAASRIRDFSKRALLVPLAFGCTLLTAFAGTSMWASLQDQIAYEMSSPDGGSRASAYGWAEIMLQRFPNQALWPAYAESIARFHYERGEYVRARARYDEIADRFAASNQWSTVVARAQAALQSPDFGSPAPVHRPLEIPMVDYETYLTRNWMALLSTIRYWEGADVPESEVKIRLKSLSRSDDKILLNPLTSLAELHDAATSLGYEVIVVPTDGRKARALISAGLPVIHADHGVLTVLYGFDDSRRAARGYAFRGLSPRLKREARRTAKEILELEEEGQGKSKERLGRIRNEAYVESAPWPRSLQIGRSLMAVVCPKAKVDDVSRAMGVSLQDLQRESDGLLAALIGLSHLNHADVVKALEWAQVGSRKTSDPLPLYVGHLAQRLWESRRREAKSAIPLDKVFPQLEQIALAFETPDSTIFLERARQRFEADRAAGKLPAFIADKDAELLDRSDARDRDIFIGALRRRVGVEPDHLPSWISLANACEQAGDLPCRVEALEGAVSAYDRNPQIKLRLAYAYVLQNEPAKVKGILGRIDRDALRHEADYPFCLGAVAESEGDLARATREYEEAIAMRTYRAIYHLRLGALLMRQGDVARARQALEWATKVDADGAVAAEAGRLIGTLGKAR